MVRLKEDANLKIAQEMIKEIERVEENEGDFFGYLYDTDHGKCANPSEAN